MRRAAHLKRECCDLARDINPGYANHNKTFSIVINGGYGSLKYLCSPVQEHSANMPNCFGGIQALWTDVNAVLNTMAPEHAEWILKFGQPIFRRGVTTVSEKPIGLKQSCGSNKAIRIPPE